MTPAQRDNLLNAHSAAMARIKELEAERDRLQDVLFERVTVLNELDAKIEPLLRENALLRKALDDAPHGQYCHSVRKRHLPGGFEGAGCPDSHWTNGPCDCWKAALARILEAGQMDRSVKELLAKGREIWGDRRMTLPEIAVAMGVVYGDICRVARDGYDPVPGPWSEVSKEFGNMILSTIRWASDCGLDPNACIDVAIEAQKRFAAGVPETKR